MTGNHEFDENEELKKFFLNAVSLPCPEVSRDTPEGERLLLVYERLREREELVEEMVDCILEATGLQVEQIYDLYFEEKYGKDRSKRELDERWADYSRFMVLWPRCKDLIEHYFSQNNRQLNALERVMGLYFPEVLPEKLEENIEIQNALPRE